MLSSVFLLLSYTSDVYKKLELVFNTAHERISNKIDEMNSEIYFWYENDKKCVCELFKTQKFVKIKHFLLATASSYSLRSHY